MTLSGTDRYGSTPRWQHAAIPPQDILLDPPVAGDGLPARREVLTGNWSSTQEDGKRSYEFRLAMHADFGEDTLQLISSGV